MDLNEAIRYLNKKHLVFQGDGCACQMLACLSSQGGGSAQGPTVSPTSPSSLSCLAAGGKTV